MKQGKINSRVLALLLSLMFSLGLLPTKALAASTVTVRIIGENGVILNQTLDVSTVIDYTTDSHDSSSELNALDAVISATEQNSCGAHSVSYTAQYNSYYINTLAGVTPSGSDYWGTLAVSPSGGYDDYALSTHLLTAGDTYVVYYDKYIGGSANYGYQSHAWFTDDAALGVAGIPLEISVKTTSYDSNYNVVATGLSGATIYATGGSYITATAVGVTDGSGHAYITFADAGAYTLNLENNYTYAQCDLTVTGSGVAFSDLSISVTDGTNNLNNAAVILKDSLNRSYSAYSISSVAYLYRLPNGTYNYYASAGGYEPSNGTIIVSGTTTKSVALAVMSGYEVTITPGNSADETVKVEDSSDTVETAVSVVDGAYTYDLQDGSYTYVVSRSGYHSRFGSFIVNGAGQNISASALTDTAAGAAEWPAFRNYGSNMAVISDATAKGSWQAQENWTTSLGALDSYGTLTASNIVIYDGYLYVATEHGLSKVDINSGTVITTTPLSAETSYAMQIAYGDGKIFATTATGIDAFDVLTMARVWSASISSYGDYMATTPILYDDSSNTIFAGDYGDGNYTLGTYGGYSAINADDGSEKWILYGGETDAHYWAGAVIVGNYLVFGSDSGVLTSVRADSGGYASAAGTLAVTGKIRSCVAYDGTYLYFTTSSGYLYKASIDAGTGVLTEVGSRRFSALGSSSTPVVCNGRIYVGANDGIYVLDSGNLSQVAFNSQSGSVQSTALVTTADSSTVYAYFTVNSARGEIIVVKDDGANVSYDTLYIPTHAQYCSVSLIADSAGTIYYSNDSGYLSAVTNNNAVSTNKAKVDFNVTPSSIYDSNTYTTAYPTVTVKDSGGTFVATAAAGTYYLGEGSYSYTVSLGGYTTSSANFTVAAADISTGSKTISLALSKASSGGPSTDITAAVTVLRDGGSSLLSNHSITVHSGASAWDAVKEALDDAGISYDVKNTGFGVYISSVNGLAEYDKGANSGWKYSVNGLVPSLSISSYILSGGESLILYYTEDYTTDSDFSSSGSKGVVEANLASTLNSSTGAADATLSGDKLSAFNQALASQSDISGAKATIKVDTPNGTTGAKLTVPQTAISALSDKTNTDFCVETKLGTLTFDPKAIDSIKGAAGENDVAFSISKTHSSLLSEENRALVGSHPVYEINVSASGEKISSFGDGSVSLSFPYTPKSGEDTSKLTVFYINSNGKAMQMSGASYDSVSGCIIFKTSHFSKFAVAYGTPVKFADVAESDWFSSAVRYVSQYSIMSGTAETFFAPNDYMTRAMLITVLYRQEGRPAAKGTNGFTDVQDGQWYTDAVLWANANGIVSGYGGGLFGTNDRVTREQMASILYNYAKYKSYDLTETADLKAFADASNISGWAKTSMSWAYAQGLITGMNSKEIAPESNATRAQAAAVLMRFCVKYTILKG